MIDATSSSLSSGPILARVIDVQDPDGVGRVKVVYPPNADGDDISTSEWAMVAVPVAGNDYGAFMLPGVDDLVVIAFLSGDAAAPVVMGSVWNGTNRPPAEVPGSQVNAWQMKGRNGSKIEINEEEASFIEVKTSGKNAILIEDDGQKITISAGSGASTITMDAEGITVKASKFKVEAPQSEMVCGKLDVQAALSDFSGVVKGSVGQINTVVATTYTPGAGNML